MNPMPSTQYCGEGQWSCTSSLTKNLCPQSRRPVATSASWMSRASIVPSRLVSCHAEGFRAWTPWKTNLGAFGSSPSWTRMAISCALGKSFQGSPVSARSAQPLAQAEQQRRATRPGLVVRGTFSPARAWRPAVVACLARTLGVNLQHSSLFGVSQ